MFVAEVISKHDLHALYDFMNGHLQEVPAQIVMEEDGRGSCMKVYTDAQNEVHVRNLLAQGTSEFIIQELENNEIYHIIKNGYHFFDTFEKVELMQDVKKALERSDVSGELFLIRRKKLIANAIMRYLNGKQSLNVDGFVRFRAKEYLMELEDFIDQTADEFITMQEYESFLDLLRYFVSIQEQAVAHVHVVTRVNGEYLLLDGDGYEIISSEVDEFIEDMDIEENEYDDILLSSLIVLAPGAITLHNPSFAPPQMISTLEQIFAGRVKLCRECALCQMGRDTNLH